MFYQNYYSFFAVLLLMPNLPSFITSSRVIDRFGGCYRTDLPCRVSMMENTRMFTKGPLGQVREGWLDWLSKINCTFVYDVYEDTGFPNENGTYNGFIGKVQRGESDIFTMMFRHDSLPYEPGLIGPVLIEADEAIFSRKNYSNPINREIASFVEEFDAVLYSYVAFVLYIFSVTYTGIEWILTSKKVKVSFWREFMSRRRITADVPEETPRLTDLYNSYLEVLKESFMALLGQLNLNPEWWSTKILTLCFSIFLLILISGFVCNVIGSNLVVNPAPSQIDSVYWFNNNSWTRPIVVKKMFLYSLIKNSRPGTPLNHLWQVVSSSPNISIMDANMEKGKNEEALQKFLGVIEEVNFYKKAVIAPRFMFVGTIRCGCVFRPDLIKNVHISKESIAEGVLTPIMAHKVHPYVRKFFEYMVKTSFEMGTMRAALTLMDSWMPDYAPGVGVYGLKALKCQEGKHSEPNDEEWRPFTVGDLRLILLIPFAGGLVAAFALFVERMVNMSRLKAATVRPYNV